MGCLIVELQGVNADKESFVFISALIISLPKVDQGQGNLPQGRDIYGLRVCRGELPNLA